MRGLSVAEKLLLAASDVDRGDGSSFTAEDLTIAAWRRFPRVFGLRGHNDDKGLPIYPDSNRVFAEIMGSKPIRKRGYLVKIGEKMYALTSSGRATANRLAVAPSDGSVPYQEIQGKSTLARDAVSKLRRLAATRAVARVKTGEAQRLTFHDACVFWAVTPSSSSMDLEGSLANVAALIDAAEQSVMSGETDLSPADITLLKKTNEILRKEFTAELATIRKRTDERAS